MRGGEEGEVFPRRGEVPPVANDQAVAPRKQNRISGILVPTFFMTFLDQFGDGISIAVGFIVIRAREHVHFDETNYFSVW